MNWQGGVNIGDCGVEFVANRLVIKKAQTAVVNGGGGGSSV